MKYIRGKNLTLKDKKSIHISKTAVIGNNVTIYENNRIEGNTVIKDNCILYPNNYIVDSVVEKGCSIGPFARLRPNSSIGENAKIGNFVEIKNSSIGKNTKISHLAYVGDAQIGENCNVGCGAIFVNYNGKTKSKTIVKNNCFIGSNCNIIAPVVIEKNSYICAGTTLTKNTRNDDFVIGRTRETFKNNLAHKYLKTFEGDE